jgi:sigma-E factor negative regulatory protein RseA
MTEKLKQSLSAAIDDEADAFELRRVLDELSRDPGLLALWDRYHLIGSVLRGDRKPVPIDLRERVWNALQAAPDESEEDLTSTVREADTTVVVPAAATQRRSYLGRYTGLAVAASVAFAVVLGFGGMWSGDELQSGELIATDTAGVMTGAAAPAIGDASAPAVDLASEVSPSDVQRAQAYILHHTQQQALNQAGVMSFVKLATYEAP